MKRYHIETYTIDPEWAMQNPKAMAAEDGINCWTEYVVNNLVKLGYNVKQVVKMSGNFCTVMYTDGE